MINRNSSDGELNEGKEHKKQTEETAIAQDWEASAKEKGPTSWEASAEVLGVPFTGRWMPWNSLWSLRKLVESWQYSAEKPPEEGCLGSWQREGTANHQVLQKNLCAAGKSNITKTLESEREAPSVQQCQSHALCWHRLTSKNKCLKGPS